MRALLLISALLALVAASPARAAAPPPPEAASPEAAQDQDDAIQMLADITLIDAACRTRNANFGMAYAAVEQHGVRVIDLLPGGARRAAFMAAYVHRDQELAHDELCGSFALRYETQMPGLFTDR